MSVCHLPTQLWEALSKKHAKINSKKNKASSFEQYSSFYFASPQTKPWSLMTPSLNKSTFSEWISLGCQLVQAKFVNPVVIWFHFIKVWLVSLQTCPWWLYCQALLVSLVYSLRASPRCPIGSSWSYQKRFLTFLCCRTQTRTHSSWHTRTLNSQVNSLLILPCLFLYLSL